MPKRLWKVTALASNKYIAQNVRARADNLFRRQREKTETRKEICH
ncbi:TPA: hypothetical protein N0F65_003590 [Lagenidium giganteum]|uniref:Ribosomal protein L33 n=1 Tax=Lagenidium giganteum TaxID=4803 RepID=A0AAV2Z319_9STRA|nr:TPA: hypothetical protein N0F65_003590 [Lagenidium giganteum]